MSIAQLIAPERIHPQRLFVFILAMIFSVEAVVMLLLPVMVPAELHGFFTAIVDACILTSVVAPVLWLVVVRPLQMLVTLRSSLLARMITAQEEEQRRISRDLHDGVGQSLTTLMIGLRAIEESNSLDQVHEQAAELRRIGALTHEEIRQLVRGLRPTVLDDLGLLAALERYVSDFGVAHQIKTRLELSGETERRLTLDIETALYRIIQEAMTNAARHGKGDSICVKIHRTPVNVDLQVSDDGQGFDVKTAMNQSGNGGPFGLLSMQERARQVHGTFSIRAKPGQGTVVEVQIPIQEGNHGEDSHRIGR